MLLLCCRLYFSVKLLIYSMYFFSFSSPLSVRYLLLVYWYIHVNVKITVVKLQEFETTEPILIILLLFRAIPFNLNDGMGWTWLMMAVYSFLLLQTDASRSGRNQLRNGVLMRLENKEGCHGLTENNLKRVG